MGKLISLKQAKEIYGYAVVTWRKWISSGQLPKTQRSSGRGIRLDTDNIDAFLHGRATPPEPETPPSPEVTGDKDISDTRELEAGDEGDEGQAEPEVTDEFIATVEDAVFRAARDGSYAAISELTNKLDEITRREAACDEREYKLSQREAEYKRAIDAEREYKTAKAEADALLALKPKITKALAQINKDAKVLINAMTNDVQRQKWQRELDNLNRRSDEVLFTMPEPTVDRHTGLLKKPPLIMHDRLPAFTIPDDGDDYES